jgi:hypothetical protein
MARSSLLAAVMLICVVSCDADDASGAADMSTSVEPPEVAADSGPATTEGAAVDLRFEHACDAVDEALRLLQSESPQKNEDGVDLATAAWDFDLDVPAGEGSGWSDELRRDCGIKTLEMVDAACLPFNGRPNRSPHC